MEKVHSLTAERYLYATTVNYKREETKFEPLEVRKKNIEEFYDSFGESRFR